MPFVNLEIIVPAKKIRFELHDIELALSNSLRRIILSEIPNVGIRFDQNNEADQDVDIKENTCPLHNEMLSHRLSQIPICFHPNEILNFQKTNYLFEINKKNTTNEIMLVTTDDITIYDVDGKPYPDSLKRRLFPHDLITDEPILITKLKPNLFDKENGDALYLHTYATSGIASMKSGAGFSPVSLCTFKNKVDEAIAAETFQKMTKDMTPEKKEEARKKFDTLDKYRCFKKHQHSNEPRELIFDVESECAMDPIYIVFKGLVILLDKIETFRKSLMTDQEDKKLINIKTAGSPNYFEMSVKNEGHTLGNYIQSEFYRRFIHNNSILEYVGYYVPHPLEKSMTLMWRFYEEQDIDRVKTWIMAGSQEILQDLTLLTQNWISFSGLRVDEYEDVTEFMRLNK